ncbi:MAG: cytochrome c oxidase assembly protein [Pseudomonas sp.]|uniref:cytochrome c oxidase assembly protein n=1 Tax=Pseudomonas sp. TaxID=306 RepID=UPI0027178E78|nr:cytochrome c oxidase assembly protein [Pseudomonas sp.]MDO8404112.1 cytochrome c oxidase assembly protein [Pseudomonas sp.]
MSELSGWAWLEWVTIAVFVCWVSGGPKGWNRQPVLLGGAALVFFLGMQPALDLAARHSVWLHCLQSALIHHLAPILLLFAVAREPVSQARFVGGRRGLRVWVVVAFGAMSGVWMLPQLHQRLMDDATLYALMKWGMAVSGLWLCRVMGRYCHSAYIPSYKQWSFSLAVALPQLLVGLMLLFSPPLYPMPVQPMAHQHGMEMTAGGMGAQLDQSIGGALMGLSALLLLWADRVMQRKSRRRGSACPATVNAGTSACTLGCVKTFFQRDWISVLDRKSRF